LLRTLIEDENDESDEIDENESDHVEEFLNELEESPEGISRLQIMISMFPEGNIRDALRGVCQHFLNKMLSNEELDPSSLPQPSSHSYLGDLFNVPPTSPPPLTPISSLPTSPHPTSSDNEEDENEDEKNEDEFLALTVPDLVLLPGELTPILFHQDEGHPIAEVLRTVRRGEGLCVVNRGDAR